MESVHPALDFDFTQDFDTAFANIPLDVPPSSLFPGGDIPNLGFDEEDESNEDDHQSSSINYPTQTHHSMLEMDRIPNDFISPSPSFNNNHINANPQLGNQNSLKVEQSIDNNQIYNKQHSDQIQSPSRINMSSSHALNEFTNLNYPSPNVMSGNIHDTNLHNSQSELNSLPHFDIPLDASSFISDVDNQQNPTAPLFNAQEFQLMSQFFDKVGQDPEFLFDPKIDNSFFDVPNDEKSSESITNTVRGNDDLIMTGMDNPHPEDPGMKLNPTRELNNMIISGTPTTNYYGNTKHNGLSNNSSYTPQKYPSITNPINPHANMLNSELTNNIDITHTASNSENRIDSTLTHAFDHPPKQNLLHFNVDISNSNNQTRPNSTPTNTQSHNNNTPSITKDNTDISHITPAKSLQFGTDPNFHRGKFALDSSTSNPKPRYSPTEDGLPPLHSLYGIQPGNPIPNNQGEEPNTSKQLRSAFENPNYASSTFSENGNFTSSDELSMALDTLSQLSSQPSIMNRASGSRINTVPSHLLQSKTGGTGLSDSKINNGQLSKLIRSVEGADSLHTWYDYRSNQERNSGLNNTNHSGPLANNHNRNGMHSNTEKNSRNIKHIKASNGISKNKNEMMGSSIAGVTAALSLDPKYHKTKFDQQPQAILDSQNSADSSYTPIKSESSSKDYSVQKKLTEHNPLIKSELPSSASDNSKPSSYPKTRRENLSEDQKRINHIYSEKRRRDLIKTQFKEMCSLVPKLSGSSSISGSDCLAISYSDFTLASSQYSSSLNADPNSATSSMQIKAPELPKPKGRGRTAAAASSIDIASAKSKSVVLEIVYEYLLHAISANRALRNQILASQNAGQGSNGSNEIVQKLSQISVAELGEEFKPTQDNEFGK